jgi:hypothetical protein
MRRLPILFSILTVVLLGLVAAARTGPTTAQEAADGPDLAGSWRVVISFADGRTIVGLSTLGADGTAVASGLPVLPAQPGAPSGVEFASLGHGVWEATGPDTAIITVVHLRAGQDGQPLGTRTGRFAVALASDGQAFSGELVTTLSDPAGATVATFTATVQATRIAAEAPGTPAAGTPTT